MSKIALLIGVSEYKAELARLPAAVRDVEEMKRVLLHPDIGGFDQVKSLKNPDLVSMQEEIETLFAECEHDDLILLFFSGHGGTDESGKFYFTTSETRKTGTGRVSLGTTIPASFVHRVMSNSRSKHQVVILDCCYSGAFAGDLTAKSDGSIDLPAQLSGEGGAVLASSSPTEVSFEQHSSGLSVYTYYLVEGIDSGAADTGGDGHISVDELHQYAKKKVQDHAPLMKPQIYPLREGSHIILASAPISDPRLIYGRELERLVSRGEIAKNGRLSHSGRTILGSLQEALNLSSQEALDIETKVLMPHREYHKKLQRFQQSFSHLIRHGTSVNDARAVLDRLQKALSLRPEDVDLLASKLMKQRSQAKSTFLTLMGTGVVISAIVTGIYARFYNQPSLPDSIRITLDDIHDGMHTNIGDWRSLLVGQWLALYPDQFRAALKTTINAEKLIVQAETLDQGTALLDWQEALSKAQEAITLMEKVPPTDPDYQAISTYRQYLSILEQRAESGAKFAQARETARQAFEKRRTAKSLDDWRKVAELWQTAINQMNDIPPGSSHYEIAHMKAIQEYPSNQKAACMRAHPQPSNAKNRKKEALQPCL